VAVTVHCLQVALCIRPTLGYGHDVIDLIGQQWQSSGLAGQTLTQVAVTLEDRIT